MMVETARFTRRLARFIIDVFFAVFLRFMAVRVSLRFLVFLVMGDFFADFLLLAMWPSSACGRRAASRYSDFFGRDIAAAMRKVPARASGQARMAHVSSPLPITAKPRRNSKGAISFVSQGNNREPTMSDPYLDPYRNNRNLDDSEGAGALWAGIALAAFVIIGAFMFFSSSPRDNMASNTTGTNTSRTTPNMPLNKPSTGSLNMPSPTESTPSTTGSAPSR